MKRKLRLLFSKPLIGNGYKPVPLTEAKRLSLNSPLKIIHFPTVILNVKRT